MDPISWIGYLLAGTLIRARLMAVLVGIIWRLLLQLVTLLAASSATESSAMLSFLPAVVAAGLATYAVHAIRACLRARGARLGSASERQGPPQ